MEHWLRIAYHLHEDAKTQPAGIEPPPQMKSPRIDPSRRGPGALSLLLFWPFHLFNLFTRQLGQPLKFFIRVAATRSSPDSTCSLFSPSSTASAPSVIDLSKVHAMPERTIIRDRLGEEIGRIHGEKRSLVPLHQVAENFRKAIIAREDERFYRHGAFDPIGIVRAGLQNMKGKREGASTITQQLASDIFKLKQGEKRGDLARQIDRKLLEIAIAIRLESVHGKGRHPRGLHQPDQLGPANQRRRRGVPHLFRKAPVRAHPFAIRPARRHRPRAGFLQSLQLDGSRHPRARHHARADGQRRGHQPGGGRDGQGGTHRSPAEMAARGPGILRHGRHPPRSWK